MLGSIPGMVGARCSFKPGGLAFGSGVYFDMWGLVRGTVSGCRAATVAAWCWWPRPGCLIAPAPWGYGYGTQHASGATPDSAIIRTDTLPTYRQVPLNDFTPPYGPRMPFLSWHDTFNTGMTRSSDHTPFLHCTFLPV